MPVSAKICGISSPETMLAAVESGAAFVGLNFFPPSPRAVTPKEAARLATLVPAQVLSVGVLVDPDDSWLDEILTSVPLDVLQFHGHETPERVAEIKLRTGRKVIKAISISNAEDFRRADDYCNTVDWLMFDAKPPKELKNPLPGGNAVQFDWTMLAGRAWPVPWFLAGGLDAANVGKAVRQSGAALVDTSSGVEDSPGQKNSDKIHIFLRTVSEL